ncbi:unnamed protein product [Parascedosporium putredinis]|uniref:CWF21 domain-containing protein n=1 Tax=Parascedosporium putredinis TaxID=1442378 RepID=A0A9P1HBT0_9PEZI|nr:unnamed protein product [Parascedosporium putredinis]CAI8003088.1 unnamed protein product [Parascedosporium putredinis]
MKPRDYGIPYPQDADRMRHKQRQPDKEILEHEAKREIEVQVLELRDQLEDEGLDEDEIDDRCDELRKKLQEERKKGGKQGRRGFKTHEVHSMADAKIKESEKLRNALKISKDYEEGDHWRRQEERTRGAGSSRVEAGGDKERERESRKRDD